MRVDIKFSQSYHWLNSWVLANIIQLGTQSFCTRFYDYMMDPGRRLFDQMVLAARCGVANIAEGSARHSTSIETEMRLIDVARASLDELQGDYFNFLLWNKADIWPIGHTEREAMWHIELSAPHYSNSLLHDAAIHILEQKSKYDPWIEHRSQIVAANAMLILCSRINRMLESQLNSLLAKFREQGGFSENMTDERIIALRQKAVKESAPKCPLCGKPMLKRLQKRGHNTGHEFWGCSDFPRCKGARHIDDC